MAHFHIDFGQAILKITFDQEIDFKIIHYTGRTYQVETRAAEETEENLIFSFSFSRIQINWNTIIDFKLQSTYK